MSEENPIIYALEFKLSRYVPDDNGYYIIWSEREGFTTPEDIIPTRVLLVNHLESYVKRRLMDND